MKKLLNTIIVSALSAVVILPLGSCTKKIDEAFANPNALVKQPIESLLPGVQASMLVSASANGNLYGVQRDLLYIGRFVQFWATNAPGNRQDQMGDFYGTTAPDLMGDIWAMQYYGHGQNISRIIQWGTEQKKWDYVGVAQAIRAWGWMTTTDVTDDLILREAFRPEQLVFKYDSQSDVYDEVINLSRAALVNLSRTDDSVSQANLLKGDQYMNGADMNKWRKFVYAVMAKTFHRTTNKSIYQPDSVIKYCNLAMQTNAENTSYTWSNAGAAGTYSWYSPFRGNVGGFRQTKFISDLMSGLNTQFSTSSIDPRAPYIIRENPNGSYKGIRPNRGGTGIVLGDSCDNFFGGTYATTTASNDLNARYIFRNAPIWPIISASEIQFVKAEALFRKGDKPGALAAYINAINLNFDQLISNYETTVPVARRITPAARAAFLGNPINVPIANNLTLSHIMMQKYIALYGWGGVETWVDMRRYHYTDIDPITGQQVYREFAPPTGLDLWPNNNGKWIYRQRPRFNSEYLYNIAELDRLGARTNDYITKECWFSKN